MAKDGGMGNIVLLGGLAVGGYFLYQYLSTGSIPADAQFVRQIPIGATVVVPQSFQGSGAVGGGPATTALAYFYYSPSTKLFYTSYTAPTAAQIAAGQQAGATSTQPSSVPVPVTTPVPIGAAAGPAASSPAQSLDSVYTKLKTLAAADANFTGTGDALSSSPDHWNYYVNQLLPGAAVNLDTLFGGPNRFSPVTAAVFWAAAGPVLGKQFGLSGLGLFAGLGAYLHEHGQFPYGWA